MTTKDKKRPDYSTKRDAVFQPEFREDLLYWIKIDRKVALRIFKLVEAILNNPFSGWVLAKDGRLSRG